MTKASLMQANNDIEAQKTATEYAFRRRIHETARAKDELMWQQSQVNTEHAHARAVGRKKPGQCRFFVCV